ncbi:MAG TPA: ECF transporter S component [Ktedonosporobacter sp.]|nr:ECF transporter S component [Ktedonosporobacter sp.]
MSETATESSTTSPWTLTTPRLVTAGVLAAITIILGLVPGLGFIPLPWGNATIEHVPVILGGILEGPIVGMVTGIVFGIISWYNALTTVPTPLNAVFVLAFRNPLIPIVPRILIGLMSWLVFASLRRTLVFPWIVRFNLDVSAFVAGFLGSITNTFFVLLLAIVLGYWPLSFIALLAPQAILEAIVAAVLAVIVTRAFFIVRGRFVHAVDTKPRDQLPY